MNNLANIRKELSDLAEISGYEKRTSEFIIGQLSSLGFDVLHGFAGYSVIGSIAGKTSGPTLLFRAELDALPAIGDMNAKAQHRCGHDGHMAVLLGFAAWLASNPPSLGIVVLLFQSAEESGQGARAIQKSAILDRFSPDYVFAWHNIPGFPENSIIIKDGIFSANVESLIIKIKGVACHAAQPDKGVNPSLSVADIIYFFNKLQNTNLTSNGFFLATPIGIQMGGNGFGTSAGEAEIQYTFRAWDKKLFEDNRRAIEDYLYGISNSSGNALSIDFSWLEPFSACINDARAVELILFAAEACQFKCIKNDLPFAWGEDFGLFTSKYKGVLFGIGAGINQHPLHHSEYAFPDGILDSALHMLVKIYMKCMNDCVIS